MVNNDDAPLAMVAIREEFAGAIDVAKRYPRSLHKFVENVRAMATRPEVAAECFYRLERKSTSRDGDEQVKVIEGASIRFAEILASQWGNARAAARVIGEDGGFIVAEGVFHDLESNMATRKEIRRRITTRSGARYGDDMVAVTANAACSLAVRNAILAGIPRALWQSMYDESRRASVGKGPIADRRQAALGFFTKQGIKVAQIVRLLGVEKVDAIGDDELIALRGYATAIRDGDASLESVFADTVEKPPPAQKPAATATAAASAPPVQELDGLGEPDPDVPDAPGGAEKPKQRRRTAANAAPVEQPNAAQPAAAPVEQPAADGPALQAGEVALPITSKTALSVSWQPIATPDAGTLQYDGETWRQWSGTAWLPLAAHLHQHAETQAREQLARRMTAHWQRSKMSRDDAIAWVTKQSGETCQRLTDLSAATLLALWQLIDDGSA